MELSERQDELDFDGKLVASMREKRSPKSKKSRKSGNNRDEVNKVIKGNFTENNGTITFYNTVDELNEDTLRNSNISGTIEAQKVEMNLPLQKLNKLVEKNSTSYNSLQINSIPQDYYPNIDNKIESNHSEPGTNLQEQKIFGIITNQTQKEKDDELFKIVGNELKAGSEIIGNKNAPIISNITLSFKRENDTLTALAFIAGNLLNKLWAIEKASSETMEIDELKKEKVQDLLALFKEPLTIRQETFLKTALESLSKAIDKHKDGKNISICESLDDAKQFLQDDENANWERSENKEPERNKKAGTKDCTGDKLFNPSPEKMKENATAKAITKINDVLSLIKKYETAKRNINDLKNKKDAKEISAVLKLKDHTTEDISDSESDYLDLFGNILQKITKLLLPYKSSKKIVNRIKNTNIFVKKEALIKKRIKDQFNSDVTNSTLTLKDKILLDYLRQIKRKPSSLFLDSSEEEPPLFSEKDNLLDLSQFLKIKSFVNLLKLLDGNATTENNVLSSKNNAANFSSAAETTNKTDSSSNKEYGYAKIDDTKKEIPKKVAKVRNGLEKFKEHLKTILEDLNELKNESGVPGKVELANIFPCIYNFVMGSNFKISNMPIDPYQKLKNVIDEMKKEFNATFTGMTRRMNKNEITQLLKQTPKSALVWERIVADADMHQNQNARRNTEIKAPTTVDKLLENIKNMKGISSANNKLVLSKVNNPTEQLMILKALHAENQRNLENLKNIRASLDTVPILPNQHQQEIMDYINKSAKKIKFHNLVLQYKNRNRKPKNSLIATQTEQQTELAVKRISDLRANKAINLELQNDKPLLQPKENKILEQKSEVQNNTTIQLSRDMILSQLIKNRVSKYIKILESKGNKYDNPNYNIAKSILLNLDKGNVDIAKQLYKIFVTTKNKSSQNVVSDEVPAEEVDKKLANNKFNEAETSEPVTSTSIPSVPSVSPMPMVPDLLAHLNRQSIFEKEPVIHFEDPLFYNYNKLLSARKDMLPKRMLAPKNLKYL